MCINFGKEDETRNDIIKKFSVIIGVRTQQKQKFRSHLDLWPSKPATFKLPVLFRKFYHRPICHRCSGGGEMALRDIFCSNVFNLWKMVSSRAKAMSKSFFSQSWRPWNEQAMPHITGFERPLRRLSTQASAEAHHSKLRCYCHSWWRFFWSGFSQPQSDRKSFTRRKTLDSSLLHFPHWSERDRGGEKICHCVFLVIIFLYLISRLFLAPLCYILWTNYSKGTTTHHAMSL